MFSQVSVCPQGGVSALLHVGIHTPPPLGPKADTPWADTPLGRHPSGQTTTQADTPPSPWQAHLGQTTLDWADSPPGRHPPGQTSPCRHPLCSAFWDAVNKPAIRIPLECILVMYMIHSLDFSHFVESYRNKTNG